MALQGVLLTLVILCAVWNLCFATPVPKDEIPIIKTYQVPTAIDPMPLSPTTTTTELDQKQVEDLSGELYYDADDYSDNFITQHESSEKRIGRTIMNAIDDDTASKVIKFNINNMHVNLTSSPPIKYVKCMCIMLIQYAPGEKLVPFASESYWRPLYTNSANETCFETCAQSGKSILKYDVYVLCDLHLPDWVVSLEEGSDPESYVCRVHLPVEKLVYSWDTYFMVFGVALMACLAIAFLLVTFDRDFFNLCFRSRLKAQLG